MSVTFLPGAGPQRGYRSTSLLYHWRASEASIHSLTGHVGVWETISGATPGQVVGFPIVGGGVIAGRGQPRFTNSTGDITRLSINDGTNGDDVDRWWTQWPLKVIDFSIFLRLLPVYAAGTNFATMRTALMMGDGTEVNGGRLLIGRTGTNWTAIRGRQGSAVAAAVAESGASVFPIDVLVNHTAAGLSIETRTSATTPVTATSGLIALSATYRNTAEPWAGSVMYMAPGGINGFANGNFHYEVIKIARGARTFAQIDLMT